MNTDRGGSRHRGDAYNRITHCLDQLEAADGFSDDVDWTTEIAPNVTVEELIGAVIAAEVELEDTDG